VEGADAAVEFAADWGMLGAAVGVADGCHEMVELEVGFPSQKARQHAQCMDTCECTQ